MGKSRCLVLFATLGLAVWLGAEDAGPDQAQRYHRKCLEKGWKEVSLRIEGRQRQLLWKGPAAGPWRGAVLALHGGGGDCSNFGAGPKLIEPMVDFSAQANREGFAVISLDSTEGVVSDPKGRLCGKRWDSMAVEDGRANVDIPFIRAAVDQEIPRLRPPGSGHAIFLLGISNGGFMCTLAATQLTDRFTAFIPIAAGDPYGTVMDMGISPPLERALAPGVFRDRETGKAINEPGAARAERFSHESPWPVQSGKMLRFKQFHHERDGVCDVSCFEKSRQLLIQRGYRDDGAFLLRGGRRSVWNHFWQGDYNRPLLDYLWLCSAAAEE